MDLVLSQSTVVALSEIMDATRKVSCLGVAPHCTVLAGT